MSKLFSRKLIAIAFLLSLATAVLHLSQQFMSWRHMDERFPIMVSDSISMRVSEGEPMYEQKMMVPAPETMPWYPEDEALDVDQRLYSTSSYSQLVVRDVSDYTERVRAAILAQDGRVLSQSIEKYGRYKVGSISARVPSESVSLVLSAIKEDVVTVVSESTSIQDETGQYVSVTEKIAALQDEVAIIQVDLADSENDLTLSERKRLELQLQRLQTQIKNLENSKDSVEENVQYARVDVSVSDGARYFDPTARPTGWELLEMGWGVLQTLGYFVWHTLLLTALYMLIWLPITLVMSLAFGAIKSK
ncbi:MAG: DUF4349 domain-containing protein [bacterium]|nr:DUF4349 domain-containing protein [bacterium]